MADGSEAGPSARSTGGASGSGSGSRKGKFTPNVTARRKKQETAAAGSTLAEQAAAQDAEFEDLMKAAGNEGQWERGRGRGRGRGPQRYQVVLGGSEEQHLPGSRRTGSTWGSSSGGAATGGGHAAHKPGAPSQKLHKIKEEDMKDLYEGDDKEPRAAEAKPKKEGLVLDLTQYYPTTLPLAGNYEEEYDETGERRLPVPKDMAVEPDADDHTVDQLEFREEIKDSEGRNVYLFQLPSLLPFARPEATKAASDVDGGGTAAVALRDLPSGHIGKLRLYESGAAQLVIGGVVMDVTSGITVQTHQEVVAINASHSSCVMLGDVTHRVVASPNVWQLLSASKLSDTTEGTDINAMETGP